MCQHRTKNSLPKKISFLVNKTGPEVKASSLKAFNAIPRERLCYAEHMRAGKPSRTWKHSWHTNESEKVGRPRWELNLGPLIASQRHSRMATPALSKINFIQKLANLPISNVVFIRFSTLENNVLEKNIVKMWYIFVLLKMF